MNAYYTIQISAVDQGFPGNTALATLDVNIDDVNDNPPIFTEYTYIVIVEEDTPVSSIILTVQAVDIDFGSNSAVMYSIVSQSADYFEVESSIGAITLKRTLINVETERTEYQYS
ncbi:Protocadherin gamma B4 [Oopsacas minuta]|uniref:Protocadherin gamma B4 n=1 Tax=Oopsacas minuta TaxID=111878 RepID=A0AAV7K3K0_9METZ|nr:Protocadherin gamma B4 [Oopsacas minuta]